jgi:hypothetical protein
MFLIPLFLACLLLAVIFTVLSIAYSWRAAFILTAMIWVAYWAGTLVPRIVSAVN